MSIAVEREVNTSKRGSNESSTDRLTSSDMSSRTVGGSSSTPGASTRTNERRREHDGEMSNQRFNELRAEEVVYAIHRQDRTFLPSEDHCPLCPTPADLRSAGAVETEIPLPAFEIAVFDNLYPAFQAPQGAAEVVVYTDSHHGFLGTLAPERAEALMWVWRHRYQELGAREDVRYVLIFENRGVEVGATLHHPHGQIYGYPFLPPVPKLELAAVAAYVPYAARWPYETHVVTSRHRPSLLDCEPGELRLLAECLQTLTRGYDALFARPFPYVMVVHQAPTDGHSDGHLHVEFYPPLRTATKLKYPAGSEQGAGTFVGDTLPEDCAAALREAIDSVA
jgi:UDPglucose--hexose-1-phosphate uridylyltransferase